MLNQNKFSFFTPGTEIKPGGWLKRQLEIQAEGLSGNLDKIWPDIRDSKWIGGSCEGWERVPYWLDGFIPLAFLLDNRDMIKRAKSYVNAIIDRQEEDGWICPCTLAERDAYDTWAVLLICKVLCDYHRITGDERAFNAVYKALNNLNSHIDKHTLFNWGAARWYEGLISVYYVYELENEDWLVDLAHKLNVQGIDYTKLFDNFRMAEPENNWTFLSHVVNLAMCLKGNALMSRLTGEDGNGFAKKALALLLEHHGTPTGHFSGDECLSGKSPIQGTELCGVAEAMYSYEQLMAVTGDTCWGDMLERLAFNAYPATVSPDMWTHQYDQMANQVESTVIPEDKNIFRTNSGESHIFGLEPNFGCCTANFSQAFPKFTSSVLMRAKDGIALTAIAPVKLTTKIDGVKVKAEVITDYPFKDSVTIKIKADKPVSFKFYLRVPGFARSATIDGDSVCPGTFYALEKTFRDDTVTMELDFDFKLQNRTNNLMCLDRGPLLFALQIKEKWMSRQYTKNGVERKFPYCDYDITAGSPWNYALKGENFILDRRDIGQTPFSSENPPVSVKATGVKIDWRLVDGRCTEIPDSTAPISGDEEITLIPYGCTNLRLTEMPLIL